MKNLFTKVASLLMLLATMSITFVSCSSDDDITLLEGVSVTVSYDSAQFTETTYAGQSVSITNTTTQAVYTATTDGAGKATFLSVVPGVYSVSISHEVSATERANMKANPGANKVMVTGSLTSFQVYAEGASETVTLQAGVVSSLVIAKFYTNGVKDDNDKSYRYDYYYTVYNNSGEVVDLTNKYIGICDSYSTNPFADAKEENLYMQTIHGLGGGTLAAGETRVFALQAIDHTASATASVNISGADFEIRNTPSTTADSRYPGNDAVPNLDILYTTFSGIDYLNLAATSKGGLNIVIFESTVEPQSLPTVAANPTATRPQYFAEVSTSTILDGVSYTKYKLTDGAMDTEYMEKYTRLPNFIDAYTYLSENTAYLGIAFTRKIAETDGERAVLQDTNNSFNDFSKTTVLAPRDFTVVEPVTTTE